MPPKPGHQALRAGRVSLSQQVYLLTTVTKHRRPLFLDPALARTASQCLHSRQCWGDASLLCWVLMPDHWHGLVRLGAQENLSSIMSRMKATSSRQLNLAHRCAHIWSRGFHDRALRQDDGLRAAARYIVANPVRAGLVAHICDYPYWDCVWL